MNTSDAASTLVTHLLQIFKQSYSIINVQTPKAAES